MLKHILIYNFWKYNVKICTGMLGRIMACDVKGDDCKNGVKCEKERVK